MLDRLLEELASKGAVALMCLYGAQEERRWCAQITIGSNGHTFYGRSPAHVVRLLWLHVFRTGSSVSKE